MFTTTERIYLSDIKAFWGALFVIASPAIGILLAASLLFFMEPIKNAIIPSPYLVGIIKLLLLWCGVILMQGVVFSFITFLCVIDPVKTDNPKEEL